MHLGSTLGGHSGCATLGHQRQILSNQKKYLQTKVVKYDSVITKNSPASSQAVVTFESSCCITQVNCKGKVTKKKFEKCDIMKVENRRKEQNKSKVNCFLKRPY